MSSTDIDSDNSFDESFQDTSSIASGSFGLPSPKNKFKQQPQQGSPSSFAGLNLLSRGVLSSASKKEVVVRSTYGRNKQATTVSAGRLKITLNNRGTWSSGKIREWQELQRASKANDDDDDFSEEESTKIEERRQMSRARGLDEHAPNHNKPITKNQRLMRTLETSRISSAKSIPAQIQTAYSVYLRAREQKRKDLMEGVPSDFYELNKPKLILFPYSPNERAANFRGKKRKNVAAPSVQVGPAGGIRSAKSAGVLDAHTLDRKGHLSRRPNHSPGRFQPSKDGKASSPRSPSVKSSPTRSAPVETFNAVGGGEFDHGITWKLTKNQSESQNCKSAPLMSSKSARKTGTKVASNISTCDKHLVSGDADSRSLQKIWKICHESFPVTQGLKKEGMATKQLQWKILKAGDCDIHKVWPRKTEDLTAAVPAAIAKSDCKHVKKSIKPESGHELSQKPKEN